MPRLFPSLSRTRKAKQRLHNDYPVYEDYGRYEQQPQYQPQHYGQAASTLPRVIPHTDSRDRHDGGWAEEVVEYPESYSGAGDYHRGTSRRQRPAVHDYSVHSESTVTPLDDHYSHYNTHYGRDNAVPIVQRESSFSRLQEAFADRPVTQVSLPQGTPRPSPRNVGVPPVPPPMVPAEVRNVYAEQHQPVLVPNTSVHSIEPEFVRSASQHRGRTEEHRRFDSRRDYYPRDRSPSSGRSLEDEHGYPPCVVVVERGRHGKKDTYYVIPGGAPVVFEDEEGRELTRVGDFSGHYRPQRQRPVIIEDDHGNEIGRLGFGDEFSLDFAHRNRSEEDFYARDREYNSRHRHKDYDDDRVFGKSHSSRRYDERDYERNDVRDHSRGRKSPSASSPNVIFIPPSDTSRASSRHSSRPSRRNYEPSHHSSNTSRSHDSGSASVIHLDQFYRPSGSVSSGSSGRRSHGSSHRR